VQHQEERPLHRAVSQLCLSKSHHKQCRAVFRVRKRARSRVVQIGASLVEFLTVKRRRLISARVSEPASSQALILTSLARTQAPPTPSTLAPSTTTTTVVQLFGTPRSLLPSRATPLQLPALSFNCPSGSSDWRPTHSTNNASYHCLPRGEPTTRRHKELPPASHCCTSLRTLDHRALPVQGTPCAIMSAEPIMPAPVTTVLPTTDKPNSTLTAGQSNGTGMSSKYALDPQDSFD
jgi:hypothetical protein